MTFASKLNPARFPNMSPHMAAITGYVLEQTYTKLEIAEIAINEQGGPAYNRLRLVFIVFSPACGAVSHGCATCFSA